MPCCWASFMSWGSIWELDWKACML
jgi:hypothetical protein